MRLRPHRFQDSKHMNVVSLSAVRTGRTYPAENIPDVRLFWWRSWLRHCATSRKIAGSIPYGVIEIFH